MRLLHPDSTEERIRYLAAVKGVDDTVRSLISTIRAKNESRETLIIFQSDNGAHSFEENNVNFRRGCNFPFKLGFKTDTFRPGLPGPVIFGTFIKGTKVVTDRRWNSCAFFYLQCWRYNRRSVSPLTIPHYRLVPNHFIFCKFTNTPHRVGRVKPTRNF